jgi:hypothetical protein
VNDGRARVRRALSRIGLAAAIWAAVLAVTHGVSFALGPLHISSRNARNPAIASLVLLAAAWFLAPAGAAAEAVFEDFAKPTGRLGRLLPPVWEGVRRLFEIASRPPAATLFAVVLVVLTLAVSWTRGAYIAGGSDSYGYVSEGHLFATGRLRADVPLANAFPHVPLQAMTPLGYRPS